MFKIIVGDALESLRAMEPCTFATCVTSPPYWQLRDYGAKGQIGLEATPEEYVEKLVAVFREVWRVLRDDGTLWLNIADTYSTGTTANRQQSKTAGVGANRPEAQNSVGRCGTPAGCKTKDLIGIPWMLAFALRADGWYLRQEIIWAKPNPMPESVTDRCTKSHETLFLLSKSRSYYFDAETIKEPCVQDERANGFRGGAYVNGSTFDNQAGGKRAARGNYKVPAGWDTEKGAHGKIHREGRTQKYKDRSMAGAAPGIEDRKHLDYGVRNKRDVWTIATAPFKEAHFATFPPELVRPCVLAGSCVGDTVLDPFAGSGTVGLVAKQEGRNFVGIDLVQKYADMGMRRINAAKAQKQTSLFATMEGKRL